MPLMHWTRSNLLVFNFVANRTANREQNIRFDLWMDLREDVTLGIEIEASLGFALLLASRILGSLSALIRSGRVRLEGQLELRGDSIGTIRFHVEYQY